METLLVQSSAKTGGYQTHWHKCRCVKWKKCEKKVSKLLCFPLLCMACGYSCLNSGKCARKKWAEKMSEINF